MKDESSLAAYKNEKTRYNIGEPLEVSPRAGDLLFTHPLFWHAKPINDGG